MSNSDRNVMGSSCLTLTTQHFDNDCYRSELARMIVMHDYPLSMVEHEGFRDFCLSLQPLIKLVSRKTIRSDIVRMYEEENAKVMKLLTNIPGRVAITSNMWTATNQKKGYMTVAAHLINESWHLQDWNIDRKLSTLTLDNYSTNNCMIDLLLDKLVPSSLILYGQLLHMRCVAHILNLIVKSGLEVINCGVEKIRDSVAFWTATPKRMEKFEEAARQLNLEYAKKGSDVVDG
ncbi:hypothetical protein Ddye_025790 [Dipteronia dyeriana]|uniref:Uncharacterized protein n=1 Tax=Dipteronia dyeriana TaxID=168575 RepID=A0AAD9WPX6_9ROSI|nr:hypothetical protein Ddye_025790 [Dipteronia dyeriana]